MNIIDIYPRSQMLRPTFWVKVRSPAMSSLRTRLGVWFLRAGGRLGGCKVEVLHLPAGAIDPTS